MGVRGHYVLELRCDEGSCDQVSEIKAVERNLAIQEARACGWIIGTSTKCPKCVQAGKELRGR